MKLFAVVSLLAVSYASANDCCTTPGTTDTANCPPGTVATADSVDADTTTHTTRITGEMKTACCTNAGLEDLDWADLNSKPCSSGDASGGAATTTTTTNAKVPEVNVPPVNVNVPEVNVPPVNVNVPEVNVLATSNCCLATSCAEGTVATDGDTMIGGVMYTACCPEGAGAGIEDLDFCSGEAVQASGGASLNVAFGAAFVAVALHAAV